MATSLEKLCKANRWRIRAGQKLGAKEIPAELISSDYDGFNGDFLVPLSGELWHVRISDGMGWRHLSATNAQRPTMTPTWEVMCRLKDLFFDDSEWCVQFMPPKEENINVHPHCLHIWSSLHEPIPHPMVCMV